MECEVIFMNSSTDKFITCISRKTPNQMFLSVSGGHICAPQMDINMASPYKALQIWVKRFCEHLTYGLFHRPDSWLVYLSSSISQILDFLYWLVCIFIFDSMTVKTQNTVYGPWSVRSLVHDFSKKYNMGKNERSDDLLISIFAYDKVSAFPPWVKTWH